MVTPILALVSTAVSTTKSFRILGLQNVTKSVIFLGTKFVPDNYGSGCLATSLLNSVSDQKEARQRAGYFSTYQQSGSLDCQ